MKNSIRFLLLTNALAILLISMGFIHPANGQISLNSSGLIGIGQANPVPGRQVNLETQANIGLRIRVMDVSGNSSIALIGEADTEDIDNYGIRGLTDNGDLNVGVYGYAHTGSGMISRGVRAIVDGGGNGQSTDKGIYASALSEGHAGYFEGYLYSTGGQYSSSDERLKKNISQLDGSNMLSRLSQLKPLRFQFLSEEELQSQELPRLNTSDIERYGLSAQDVEDVFPDLVREVGHVLNEGDGTDPEERTGELKVITSMAVNYTDLIPVLISGIQEQQRQIEELETQNEEFEARLTALENMVQE